MKKLALFLLFMRIAKNIDEFSSATLFAVLFLIATLIDD